MKYRINSTGQIIVADQDFVDQHYPDDYELIVEESPTTLEVWDYLIDIGPFFDRFGAQKMAVLTSQDAGVKAILQDVSIRKWVDLRRADVVSALAYIGSKIPGVTPALQSDIITIPVSAEENRALKKLYF